MRRLRRAVAALLLLPLVGSFTASPRFVSPTLRRSALIVASAFTPDVDENGENAEAGIIIKSSPGKGFGAFATRTIQEETEVGEYVGEIVTSKQVATRYEAEGDYPVRVLSNDHFRKEVEQGNISAGWRDEHTIKYKFMHMPRSGLRLSTAPTLPG